MATKLSLYNEALRILGERPLASLDEGREPRRHFDAAYDLCLQWCLEQGQWKHGRTVAKLETASAVAPIGRQYAFDLPADFARLYRVSPNERLDPSNDWTLRDGVLHVDFAPAWLEYVSEAADKGQDLAAWSATYTTFVATALAARCCFQATHNAEMHARLEDKALPKALARAKTFDAFEGPVEKQPGGSFIAARTRLTYGRANGEN